MTTRLRIRRLRSLLLAVVFAFSAVAFVGGAAASHVSPTVRDVDMANLPEDEAELSIIVDPSDPHHVAAGANQRPGGQHWYVSSDGGRKWSDGALPPGTLTVLGRTDTLISDPSLDFGSDGEIYYGALMHFGSPGTCTLFVTASGDDGANWSDPANGVVAAATAPLVCNDKEMIAVDRANNDNVYVAWNPYETTYSRQVAFSRDLNGISDGLAFSSPTLLSDGICRSVGPDLAVAGNSLYVAWTTFCPDLGADGDFGTVYVTKSTDQGGSWSTPVAAATLYNVSPDAKIDPGFRARSMPSIDVDQVTGRVFVAYNSYATPPTTDPDIYVVSSPDATAGSWTAPLRVNQDVGTTEQVLPWVAVGEGRVHVAYYSRANDGTNWNLHVAYGAATAAPILTEVTVSSASTPPTTGFIGDYTGNFVGSDDVLHPAWTDGRSGVGGKTDAYTARMDFSPPTAFTVSPPAASLVVGATASFTATVTGAHGEAEQFIPVTFAVTSSGFPSSVGGSVVTGPAGTANFKYTNALPGTDTLHVFADLDEDGTEDSGEAVETTVTWLLPSSTDGAKATGGGTIVPSEGGSARFSFAVQKKAADAYPKGSLAYSAPSRSVVATAITAIVIDGNHASIFGTATVNGANGVDFRADAVDGGEPSADFFQIRLADGYDSGFRSLASGNIQTS